MACWPFARRSSHGFSFSSTAEEVTDGIDASNITAIVTGASSGIGAETARVLALRGAQVVMAVRTISSGEVVKANILKETNNARVHVLQLDLSSMASVRNFASEFKSRSLPLNVLINNAGIMACPFQLSPEKIELQFATNHVGHFLLTNLLLEDMKHTAQASGIEGRIVQVSSAGHKITYWDGIRFDKLNDPSSYARFLAYGQSKLANVLHVKELARRFQEGGLNITANSLHPGVIRTNLVRHNPIIERTLKYIPFSWKTIPQGAATQCFLALHPLLKGVSGKYFSNCEQAKPSGQAMDASLAKTLWEFSETLTAPGS